MPSNSGSHTGSQRQQKRVEGLPVPDLAAQLLQEAPVDVEDDLHVPRQKLLDQAHRPLLQRLREHRVVREGKHLRTATRAASSQNRNARQPFCVHHRKGIMRSSNLRALLVPHCPQKGRPQRLRHATLYRPGYGPCTHTGVQLKLLQLQEGTLALGEPHMIVEVSSA